MLFGLLGRTDGVLNDWNGGWVDIGKENKFLSVYHYNTLSWWLTRQTDVTELFCGRKNVIKDNTPLLSKYQSKKQSSRRKGESQDIHVLNNLQSIIESPRWRRAITTTKIREYAKTRTSTSDKWKNSSLLSQNLSQSNYDK